MNTERIVNGLPVVLGYLGLGFLLVAFFHFVMAFRFKFDKISGKALLSLMVPVVAFVGLEAGTGYLNQRYSSHPFVKRLYRAHR